MNVPQYVIVHRRDNGRTTEDTVHDIHLETDRAAARRRAAEMQHDANNRYGRPNDTYRVARLAFIDEEI